MGIRSIAAALVDSVDIFLTWLSSGLKQNMDSYCDIVTADSLTDFASNDGLCSVIKVRGVNTLVGQEEFNMIRDGMLRSTTASMSRPGHVIQVFFTYNKDTVQDSIKRNYETSQATCNRLNMDLDDLYNERVHNLAKYCSEEEVYLVLWTTLDVLVPDMQKRALAERADMVKEGKVPEFRYTQNFMAAIPELRDSHGSFVRSVANDLNHLGVVSEVMEVHEAANAIRRSVDGGFTDHDWKPVLPGDKYRPKLADKCRGDISDLMWPSLSHQLMPRDAVIHNLKTCEIGNTIFSTIYIDIFPREVQRFMTLFTRIMDARIPWRMSFLVDSAGMGTLKFKRALSSVLAFSSAQNRLINDSIKFLDYIELNSDDAVVKLRVAATTWAESGDEKLLANRLSQLSRAIQGWGNCDVSEFCGDAFAGTVSTMLGISRENTATSTVASYADVLTMLPIYRPSSPWDQGALLFRTPDGKPFPFQPCSKLQTTWIDLLYARPGSGKSVLSNALNLALCMSAGLERLPRIAIVDIGPSSSGLISLLKEALPDDKRYLAQYYRLQNTPDYAINPFDTQLGCRYPMPLERSFLTNFVTLLVTPVGAVKPFDGMADMVGMVIDEAYKTFADENKPNVYSEGIDDFIDSKLQEIGFVIDQQTTWWEVTDALFAAGFTREAIMAQRYAVPMIGDLTSTCRLPAVEDLYGEIKSPTGEALITAFVRMISASIREYPIISHATQFDIGEARVVSLDLDEVAKSGGATADRQTGVMYMLSRYVLAKDFYLTEESLTNLPEAYRAYHEQRVREVREDPKRIVYDEFHRTARASAVRDQVIVDMREGRKWNVSICLISQSLDDYDSVMVEFGTSVFIMDAGPETAINKTTKVFGLSKTGRSALKAYVHGPSEVGANVLAQFATKGGMYTQVLTLTLGPVELWAFSTTVEDATLRNRLYEQMGPAEARRVLANLFPSGSATKYIALRLQRLKKDSGLIEEEVREGVLESVYKEILAAYQKDANTRNIVPLD